MTYRWLRSQTHATLEKEVNVSEREQGGRTGEQENEVGTSNHSAMQQISAAAHNTQYVFGKRVA